MDFIAPLAGVREDKLKSDILRCAAALVGGDEGGVSLLSSNSMGGAGVFASTRRLTVLILIGHGFAIAFEITLS